MRRRPTVQPTIPGPQLELRRLQLVFSSIGLEAEPEAYSTDSMATSSEDNPRNLAELIYIDLIERYDDSATAAAFFLGIDTQLLREYAVGAERRVSEEQFLQYASAISPRVAELNIGCEKK